jgi:hypothetical protein
MNNITPEDLVFYNDGNNFQSSGYTLDSILLNGQVPPMQTMNVEANVQSGGMMSELLKDFAVPAGLLLLQQTTKKSSYPILHRPDDDGVMDESLYDKLMKISNHETIETRNKHKPTRKNKYAGINNNKENKYKKTRRNKN